MVYDEWTGVTDGQVVNTEGATSVVAAGPAYDLISINELAGGVYATPAIADGGILLRTAGDLVFIDGPASG